MGLVDMQRRPRWLAQLSLMLLVAGAIAAWWILKPVAKAGADGRGGQAHAAPKSAEPPRDPWMVTKTHVERFAGAAPVDCGQHHAPDFIDRSTHPNPTESNLKKSLECGQRSSRRKIPFWTAMGGNGIDTWNAVGVLGQQDGSLHLFYVCLGQYCSEEFSLKWCLAPEVRTNQSGVVKFECARFAIERKAQ